MTEPVSSSPGGSAAARPTCRGRLPYLVRIGVLVIAGALTLAGCAPGPPENPREAGAGPVSTDPAPVAAAYPELAGFTEVHWVTGRSGGGDRDFGPSSYFMQTVITLPVEKVTELMQRHRFDPTGAPQQVVSGLQPFLPPAGTGWRRSDEFDYTPRPDWLTVVYARPGSPVVYVNSVSG